MVELKFYTDVNFDGFIEDAKAYFGSDIPGTVNEYARVVLLSLPVFAAAEHDLRELVRDYGGRMRHVKTV